MWARGGLPPDVATRAAALTGVVTAAHVRSDTIGLTGSRDADGTVVDDLEPGWRIPVEVRAVDPQASARTVHPGPAREAIAALEPGQVLLPASSAERRGLTVGGTPDLEGRAGLVVAAIVEDDVLGGAEVVLHVADADAVGLDTDGSLHVVHDGSADAGLASALQALAPADTAVRVVGAGPEGPARRAPLVLGLPEVKDRFGEFAFRDDNDDCYHARRIGSHSNRLPHHSWGIAIDINVDLSLPGLGPPPEPAVVEGFAAHGFRWGGLFLSPDNHHFEWVGEAAAHLPPRAGVGDA